MMPVFFAVGARVQARTSGFVPVSTAGTIQHVLHSSVIMYYVQFDGYDQPKLMHTRDLEPVDIAAPLERQRAAGAG
jgi:hypothetical protein